MKKRLIIAIDGYSSCGKSSFAKLIARELNYLFIDSGAMYRAVTLFALRNRLIENNTVNRDKIAESLSSIQIDFRYNTDRKVYETFLNNENVEEEIRRFEVSNFVSPVSQIKEVREKMVELQREIGVFKGIVMDGRDIGTVVFPDADIKIFMTASHEIRARRRYDELAAKGIDVDYEKINLNISSRDKADSEREISPLKKADDAIVLDNSNMTINEQMVWFGKLIEKMGDEN
ncbi:MAG: (d)CMP kinase [Bacteroidales bacterium]|nr:(d)CMP kinase [Bacteroidales bacterium]